MAENKKVFAADAGAIRWVAKDGKIDLASSQIPEIKATVGPDQEFVMTYVNGSAVGMIRERRGLRGSYDDRRPAEAIPAAGRDDAERADVPDDQHHERDHRGPQLPKADPES